MISDPPFKTYEVKLRLQFRRYPADTIAVRLIAMSTGLLVGGESSRTQGYRIAQMYDDITTYANPDSHR
jgi:hypothetical protein